MDLSFKFCWAQSEKYCGIPICNASQLLNQIYIQHPEKAITKNYLWEITTFIRFIIFPSILAIGTILNMFSIAVFTRPSLRKSTTSLLLTILAFNDTGSLYIIHFVRWLRHINVFQVSTTMCRIYIYFNFVIVSMSNWILVIVTMERVTAITLPHKAKRIFTRKYSSLIVIVITIFIYALNIPVLFGIGTEYHFIFDQDDINFVPYGRCQYCCILSGILLKAVLLVFDISVPFSIILIGNIKIILTIIHAKRRRKDMTSAEQSKESQVQSITKSLMLVRKLAIQFSFR